MQLPDDNPKTAYGVNKPSFHFTPPVAEMVLGQAMRNGGDKYGAMNWREAPVSASTYYDAMRRHIGAWLDGEDIDADSGVHHLGHVMACAAILIDAAAQNALNDDRPIKGTFSVEAKRLTAKIKDVAPNLTVCGCASCNDTRGVLNTLAAVSEPKFKVGDRVRVVAPLNNVPAALGKIGTLLREWQPGWWDVRFDQPVPHICGGDSSQWSASNDMFELFTFKVGDRVRCNCLACRGNLVVGVITAADEFNLTVLDDKWGSSCVRRADAELVA